jgi:hypothetical protein
MGASQLRLTREIQKLDIMKNIIAISKLEGHLKMNRTRYKLFEGDLFSNFLM